MCEGEIENVLEEETMKMTGLKKWMSVMVWMLVVGLSGCGEDPKQLFETAQFEEKQNNQAHARELYERVIQTSPDSEWAKRAKARLAELGQKEEL